MSEHWSGVLAGRGDIVGLLGWTPNMVPCRLMCSCTLVWTLLLESPWRRWSPTSFSSGLEVFLSRLDMHLSNKSFLWWSKPQPRSSSIKHWTVPIAFSQGEGGNRGTQSLFLKFLLQQDMSMHNTALPGYWDYVVAMEHPTTRATTQALYATSMMDIENKQVLQGGDHTCKGSTWSSTLVTCMIAWISAENTSDAKMLHVGLLVWGD